VSKAVVARSKSALAAAFVAAVLGRQTLRTRRDPYLAEAQRLLVQVVLRMLDASPSGHELNRAAAECLTRAHGVLMRQLALHDVRDDLDVSVGVPPKATLSLDEIVIQHPQRTKVGVLWVVV
jgi:hypothetical protein